MVISCLTLWNGARYDQGYCWRSIGTRICALDFCQNQWPWMIPKSHNAHLWEFTTNIWKKADRHDHQQNGWIILVSGSISCIQMKTNHSGARQRQFPVLSLVSSSESLQVRPTTITLGPQVTWHSACLQLMMSANFKPKTPTASRGFLVTAWLSCWILALCQAHEQSSVGDSHR